MKPYNAQFCAAQSQPGSWQPDAYFDNLERAKTYIRNQVSSNPRIAEGRVINTITGQVEYFAWLKASV